LLSKFSPTRIWCTISKRSKNWLSKSPLKI
jgi:hypothetical protein